MSEPEYYTTKFPWTRNLVMRTIGEEGWHHEGEILYGQDVVDAFFKPVESGGWSLEQKEAIRAELALLMGLSSVVFREEVDGDLVKSLINKTMLAMEAITKGEE